MAELRDLLHGVTALTPVALELVVLSGLLVGIALNSLALLSVAAAMPAERPKAESSRIAGLWLPAEFSRSRRLTALHPGRASLPLGAAPLHHRHRIGIVSIAAIDSDFDSSDGCGAVRKDAVTCSQLLDLARNGTKTTLGWYALAPAVNPQVPGSSPGRGARSIKYLHV